MVDLFVTLFIVFLLIGLGTLIKYFGGEGLISGYNTASAEEQKYARQKGIGKFIGNYLYLLSAVILAGFLLQKAGVPWAAEISWAVFIIIVLIIMPIQARRFNPPGGLSRSARISTLIGLLIVVIVFGGIIRTALPPRISLGEDSFKISGAYGLTIKYSEIEKLELLEKLPAISMRTNGMATGPIAKGHFKLKEGGAVTLFLRSSTPPFLNITFKDGREMIIINFSNLKKPGDYIQI
ncbi:DUF3784 domain-containing protein [Syntrophomonas palmitatica]|uniref:DUF3784 domain-containing protein n=1 Tax=Syntrophomonas palmitatica TaxID=402877 RepID=UPI0006D2B572|nr:DUF3784 domain-containing protein [Syntrophomonas palmitatica]